MIRAFLDANVYFAGFLSKEGASAFVLKLAEKRKIFLLTNRIVLREAERNLRLKGKAKALAAFRRFIQETKIEVLPRLSDAVLARYEGLIHPKDVSVLGSALEGGADFLITLDRQHFFKPQILARRGKTKVLTPGEFLRQQIRKGRL